MVASDGALPVRTWGMRKDVFVDVSAADRARLKTIVADRNSPQKHVWRAPRVSRAYIHLIYCAHLEGPRSRVNPDTIRAQIESAVIFGITAVLYGPPQ